MRCVKVRSKSVALVALGVAWSAAPAPASVVVSNGGNLELNVSTYIRPDHADFYVNEYNEGRDDQDRMSFVGAPIALRASASATQLDCHCLAGTSIAVDARSDWALLPDGSLDPDHLTVDINGVASRYQSGTGFAAFYAQRNAYPFSYNFTPTVDSIMTFSVEGADYYSGTRYYVDEGVEISLYNSLGGKKYDYDLHNGTASGSFNLTAGTIYSVDLFSWFSDGDQRTEKAVMDYTRLSTRHFTLDFTKDPTIPEPPPTNSAVPEPGTWAMLLTGFGFIGATLRTRRGAAGNALPPAHPDAGGARGFKC